jgi:hypothetical protein
MPRTSSKPAITPWQPEQNRFRLAALGKLAEEAGELSARASRCIIHGLDENDPDTSRTNRDELAGEVADVLACFEILREVLSIVPQETRISSKANRFRHWHSLIMEGDDA